MLMPLLVVATLTEPQTRSVAGQRLGYGVDEMRVAGGEALVHERRIAADEIDVELFRRPVQRLRDR